MAPLRRVRRARPFRSSGKIRLNANGRRLDAWLIYRCTACQRRWNRPVLDRVPLRVLPAADLAAFESSDPARVTLLEYDLAGLRAATRRVDSFGTGLRKSRLGGPMAWQVMEIAITATRPTGLRLDRLLAREFHLSRAGAVSHFAAAGPALRRPVADGTLVRIALDGGADRRAWWEGGALAP